MSPTNLGDLIDRSAAPEKTAIIDLSDDANPRPVTYGELAARTDAVARSMLSRGLARGDAVAILATNSVDYLCAYYGVMRAGLVAVPLSFKFPSDTIRYMLGDCGAKLVFADEERATICPEDVPVIRFGVDGPGGFDGALDPGPFDCVDTGPDGIGVPCERSISHLQEVI